MIITLLSDFGLTDGYPGIMKGVIWGIVPEAHTTDLTHSIRPHDIMEGALTLGRAAPYFPPGTVHIAVVDPGVGTKRRPIAARLGEYFFVGPDNGLLTLLLERAEKLGGEIRIVHLDQPRFWMPTISNVFHGRDIFAPSAAHLAKGVSLEEMGTPITDAVRLKIPQPRAVPGGWIGSVLHIDHFGNISTNIHRDQIPNAENIHVYLCEGVMEGLVGAFGDGNPGELVALVDSSDHLSVCVVNGNAAERLGARVGDPIEVLNI